MNTLLYVGQPDTLNGHLKALQMQGWTVQQTAAVRQARDRVRRQAPSVVVVDGTKPRLNVVGLSDWLRHRHVPVIVLHRDGYRLPPDIVADALLTLPCTAGKLLRTVQDVQPAGGHVLAAAGLRLNLQNSTVTVNGGEEVHLQPKGRDLLEYLMRNVGETATYQDIMRHVWHTDYLGDTRTLQTHICWLREKVWKTTIVTVRGVGYRLEGGKDA